MGAGAAPGLPEAVFRLWDSGLAGLLLGGMALAVVVLVLRIRASRSGGRSEGAGAGGESATAQAAVGLVDARTGRWPEWWSSHPWHVNGYTDPTCGECTKAGAMSLTDAVSKAPWPPYPELPDDVLREINYVEVRADPRWMDEIVRLTLRGGEILEFPRSTSREGIVDTVRGAMRLRERAALDAAGDITDPVVAGMALELLTMAAGRTKCTCCRIPAEGCVLPPGADATAQRCTYTGETCQCWGGLAKDGIRYCEDCYRVATTLEPVEQVEFVD